MVVLGHLGSHRVFGSAGVAVVLYDEAILQIPEPQRIALSVLRVLCRFLVSSRVLGPYSVELVSVSW